MAIKLADELRPMGDFPATMAEYIGFSDGETLQDKYNNKKLGGGDSSITLTQEEYDALTDEEKLNGLYYTYDTKRIYKNGVQYGASEPISLTMEEYKALKAAGAIDEQQEYLVEADAEGILLEASDIGYSNAVSNLPCTTVQGAIDKVNDKVDNLIDDEVSDSTVWSSKKTSDELAKKLSANNNVSMVGLGFTANSEVPLADFMLAISSKLANSYSTMLKVDWKDSNSAYVIHGNKKCHINSGILYCSQNRQITNEWSSLVVLYVPDVTSSNIYKFVYRQGDLSSIITEMNEYPRLDDSSTGNASSTWSSSKIATEISQRFPNLSIPSTKALKITRNSVFSAFIKVMDVHGNLFTLQCGDQDNRFYVIPSYIGTNLSVDITKFVKEATACYLCSNTYAMYVLEVIGDVSYSVIDKTTIPSTATTVTIA